MHKNHMENVIGLEEHEIMQIGADETPSSKAIALRIGKALRKPALPHFSDESQQKAFGYILRFLAIMLVFTIAARGTAGATLAKVDLTAPFRSEIVNAIDITGNVEALSAEFAELPPLLTVAAILVAPGQQVNKGDALAEFDIDEIESRLKREKLKLNEMELSLQKLLRDEAYDGSALTAAAAAVEWAKQDMDAAHANGQATIAQAQKGLDEAKTALEEAATRYEAVAAEPDADEEEKSIAYQNLETAKTAAAMAETAFADSQRTAQAGIDSAARALEMAEQSFSSMQIADSKARQAIADNSAQKQIDAENMRLDIERQKQEIALYDAIDENGILYSDKDGIVLAVAESGEKTGGGDIITLADASAGFRAIAYVSQKDAEKLTVGSSAKVQEFSGYFEETQAFAKLVSMSEPDANNMVTAVYSLEDGSWKQGQTISLAVVQSQMEYDTCVPLSAIRQNQNGTHVLVVEETSGIMGVEITVREVPVMLLADDGHTAAISGDIGFGRTIVSSTSKSISDGDKVRVNM